MGGLWGDLQFHHFIGQQSQRPVRITLGRFSQTRCDDPGFFVSRQAFRASRFSPLLSTECLGKAKLEKLWRIFSTVFVRQPKASEIGVCVYASLQQNLRKPNLLTETAKFPNDLLKLFGYRIRQSDNVLFFMAHLLVAISVP